MNTIANEGVITVIGSANVDTFMRLERLPRVGETVTDGVVMQAYGGKGANQAVGAARAGGRVAFVGCLGDDSHGHTIRDNFLSDGIDVRSLILRPGIPTGSALVLVDRHGNNCIAVAPGANHALTPDDIDANADVIDHASLLVMQMELPSPATARTLERAAARGIPVLFNFAPAHSLTFSISSAMTGLVVNETEAEALFGRPVQDSESARAAAEALLARGPSFVVVTLGGQGVVIVSADVRVSLPPFPVTPVDTTGAGDIFCGALAVSIVEGQDLPVAARFASAAAALSVTRIGAQPSAPLRAEIDAFLTEHPG